MAKGQGPETLGMAAGEIGFNCIPIGGEARLAATAGDGAARLGGEILGKNALQAGEDLAHAGANGADEPSALAVVGGY